MLSKVLNARNQNHSQFTCLVKWIVYGKGKLVYGGSKYEEELKGFIRIFRLLGDVKKTVRLTKIDVDILERKLAGERSLQRYNDHHIAAIACLSACKLVCTSDGGAYKLLKEKKVLRFGSTVKCNYQGKDNQLKYLCDKYIAKCCQPSKVLNRKDSQLIREAIKRSN